MAYQWYFTSQNNSHFSFYSVCME